MNSNDRLAQWRDEEAAAHARVRLPHGPIPGAEATARPGLDVLRDMVAGALPSPPIFAAMDFLLLQVDHGLAVFQGRPSARFLNPLGTLHGGWYATLLDSAVGCAVHSSLPAGRAYTTLEFKINLVRPISADVPLVRAEGRTIHVGRQTATAEGKLLGADGKLYAHATTTCLIFEPRTD